MMKTTLLTLLSILSFSVSAQSNGLTTTITEGLDTSSLEIRVEPSALYGKNKALNTLQIPLSINEKSGAQSLARLLENADIERNYVNKESYAGWLNKSFLDSDDDEASIGLALSISTSQVPATVSIELRYMDYPKVGSLKCRNKIPLSTFHHVAGDLINFLDSSRTNRISCMDIGAHTKDKFRTVSVPSKRLNSKTTGVR